LKKWLFTLGFLGMLMACSTNEAAFKGEFAQEKQAAWAFLADKGWEENAEKRAAVMVTRNAQHVKWVAPAKAGEWISVSFNEKEASVIGVPVLFVDPETKKVAGYIQGE